MPHVYRAALPELVAAGGGAILNVTSVAGLRVWPLDSAHSVQTGGAVLDKLFLDSNV